VGQKSQVNQGTALLSCSTRNRMERMLGNSPRHTLVVLLGGYEPDQRIASCTNFMRRCWLRRPKGISKRNDAKCPRPPRGYRFPIPAQADGCLRTSASACIRIESAGVFAVAASFSSEGAIPFNFAMLLLLRCDLSAL